MTWWHYDVLRGLEYLCRAGAIELLWSKSDGLGRWITLRARRVLSWWAGVK